ncbi:MAG: hypothetical protein KA586_04750 [Candidatus Promineofilum sp.]|nr:hypothetical protein [Promineifilum sp.]
MDDQTDDRNPGIPPVGTPQELEEALKWLEDLTARQGKTAEVKNQSAAPTLDSPFRGLIDNEDGDLPDWLREVPKPPDADNLEETEPESRLDWLSKMAQRESIEELPTLEWRRLSEPAQSAILAGQASNLPADLQFGTDEESEGFSDDIDETGKEDVFLGETDETEEQSAEFARIHSDIEEQEEEPLVAVPAENGDEGSGSASDLAVAADTDEFSEGSDADEPDVAGPPTAEFEPDDYLPPIDDLDAAMAWIEELAASQDAPIEEIPSVADRALASKLMMEAGLTPIVSPLDELGSESSLLDSLTPTHPFIEEEDFADTIVLVETLAADQEEAVEFPAVRGEVEIIESTEWRAGEVEPVIESAREMDESIVYEDEAVEELSFDEAMAYLDEMAGQQEVEELDAAQAEPLIITFGPEAADAEEPTDESSESSDEQIVEEQVIDALLIEGAFVEDEIHKDPRIEETTADDWLTIEPSIEVDIIKDPSLEELDTEVGIEVLSAEEPGATIGDEAALWMAEEVEPDSLSAADVPWLDSVAYAAVVAPTDELDEPELHREPIGEEANAGSDQGGDGLEATLLSLDALALPSGRSLAEISTHLQVAQMSSWRDVDSALDWLEAALTQETGVTAPADELDDINLLESMPEDPDAVLAWLEQMAAEEEQRPAAPSVAYDEPSMVITTPQQGDSFVEELAEADLLNMPDDPDEAMVWLESLAQGRGTTGQAAAVEAGMAAELPQPEWSEAVEPMALETEATGEVEPEPASVGEPAVMDDVDSEAELLHSSETWAEDVGMSSEYVPETEAPTTEQVAVDTPFDPLEGLTEDDLDLILGGESGQVAGETGPADVSMMEAVEPAPEPVILESATPEIAEAAQTAKPGRKRGRAKSAATQEEVQASEPPAPATPEPERPSPSWLDLLKPLE